jgi:tetratricopeptide (TPR) repeat protein
MLHASNDKIAPAMTARDWRATITGILVFIFVLLAARDINRPFTGLHSWDQAQDAWSARSILNYRLGYTKGLTTMAVGNPPPAVPPWYLDHPQLPPLLDAGAMALFGRNEAALRLASLITTAASLPFLIALLRRLYDEETAILATFLFIVFPITPYFNYSCSCWILPFMLLAYWCYLTLIGELRDAPPPGKRHLLGLGLALFALPQLFWTGLLYTAAIGSHYLLRCLAKRRRPDRPLLLTLILSPAISAIAAFGVLLCARTGGWRSLLGVYLWRARMTNDSGRTTLGWALNQWEMLQNNFTLPAVLIVGAYLAYRALVRIRALRAGVERSDAPPQTSRAFDHAWILVMPSILHAAVFSESLWVHNHDYKWFALPFAIAAALGILQMRDSLLTRGAALANAATLIVLAVVCGFAARGINNYYAVRNWSTAEVDLFKHLNSEMAPDETLLTYQSYLMVENPHKLSYFRPEVAWYLDRDMAVATTLEDIERRAATKKYPYYLVPQDLAPPALIEQLKARYAWGIVQVRRDQDTPGVFDEGDELVFDLRGEEALMAAGLAALFTAKDLSKAANCFREVLARNPEHYGANYQLARVLDASGSPEEAQNYWKKTLELAVRFADAETARVARNRLTKGR